MKSSQWIAATLVSASFAVMATYAAAQITPEEHGKHRHKPQQGSGAGMGMHMMECPMMHAEHVDATATVENVAGGAVIRIRAKNAADAARVQALAQMIAKHVEQGCPNHAPGGPAPAP